MRDEGLKQPEPLPHVLLLEDSPSDRLLTKLALEESGVPHQLQSVEYGIDVLRFLRREPPFSDAPRPRLILLDLNVPRMDGREILRVVKGDPALATIPVVVLTTSSQPSDIRTAYECRANSYILKPTDFTKFVEAMRTTMHFWCALVEPAPVVSAPPPPTALPAADRSRQLLLLEDSPSDAALVRAALADAASRYTVTHVSRLTDALELLQRSRFDVVMADLSLPDSTGVDTVRLLASVGQAAPIVALTGSNADVGEASLSAGADDFLTKGDLTPVRLDRVLRHAIRRRVIQLDELQSQRVHTVGRLAASVAHDMNNLLAAIRLSTEALLHPGTDTTDRTEIAEEVLSTVERGASLTRQLLTFGRRSEPHRVECEVNDAVSAASAWIGRLLRADVALSLELAAEPTTVMGDAHQLEQAIVNLALNANDAMPTGGRLRLITTVCDVNDAEGALFDPPVVAGRYVEAIVRDTGVGIPADILPNLFEPFFTTKAEHEGTGLGLATVREIARLHLGGVRATNRPTGGADFILLIPMSNTVQRGSGTHRAPAAGTADTRVRDLRTGVQAILLAEDDEAVARATARVLGANGFTVHMVDSAHSAWEAWRNAPGGFDLLLTDLLMPGPMSVVDLVSQIRAVDPRFPVVYCSGYAGTMLEQTLDLEEHVNFLTKPFDAGDLLAVVRRQLATTAVPTPSRGRS